MSFDLNSLNTFAPEAKCIPAMLVWKLPKNKENTFSSICNSGEYFAEIKKDGYWYQFEKTTNYQYLFSRNISSNTGILTEKIANVPHIKEALSVLPEGTIVIGEIYYPGGTSKDVTKIMGCLPDEAIRRQKEKGLIHYYIHDIIMYHNTDLQQEGALVRYLLLKEIWNKFNFSQYDFLELAELITENIQEETIAALDRGEEGMVLKKKDQPYIPDKRPAWSSIKIKKIDYIDAICIGFCDATKEYTGKEINTWEYWEGIGGNLYHGRYLDDKGYAIIRTPMFPVTKPYFYGWKTAIRIGAYNDKNELVEIGTIASGLTDELRADFTKNPDKYLNRVVSLQCMEKDCKEHTLRHGFFKGFRDDKNISDCTLSTIF